MPLTKSKQNIYMQFINLCICVYHKHEIRLLMSDHKKVNAIEKVKVRKLWQIWILWNWAKHNERSGEVNVIQKSRSEIDDKVELIWGPLHTAFYFLPISIKHHSLAIQMLIKVKNDLVYPTILAYLLNRNCYLLVGCWYSHLAHDYK